MLFACVVAEQDPDASSPPTSEVGPAKASSDDEKCTPKAALTAVELFVQTEERLAEKKETISLVGSQLMENPEGNVQQSTP